MTNPALATIVRERAGRPWCLFLDRDGVINTRIVGGYIEDWSQFEFATGALDALGTLARWSPRIVVVTNQQGVGKGLMTLAALDDVHRRMRDRIADAGGRIDDVVFCPHLDSDDCECRKPSPGMAARYLQDHPMVDGSLSVFIGDTDSDVEMGRRLARITGGCVTVRVAAQDDPLADMTYASLGAFAAAVAEALGIGRGAGI